MTPKRRPLIAGNWKMNLTSSTAEKLAIEVAAKADNLDLDILLCPPSIYLERVGKAINSSSVHLGAQDCHINAKGAHTGDIGPSMLRDVGCAYTIVGHSERRADHCETNQIVAAKARSAWAAGITSIICVGETNDERNSGLALKSVEAQIHTSVPDGADDQNTVIAYEPIWAIGSGKTPTTNEVAEMHSAIRGVLKELIDEKSAQGIRIIYGGSLKANNAKSLMVLADVDGGLIGGASLTSMEFIAIAESCP